MMHIAQKQGAGPPQHHTSRQPANLLFKRPCQVVNAKHGMGPEPIASRGLGRTVIRKVYAARILSMLEGDKGRSILISSPMHSSLQGHLHSQSAPQ